MGFYKPSPKPMYLRLTALLIYLSTANAGGNHQFMVWPPAADSHCQGSIEECTSISEFDWDAGINRRMLQTSQYISYKSLQSDSVPCSQRGASYYNCQAGAAANPYSRSCSTIARCRG